MQEIENAFQETSAILFGKRLADIDSYGNWLERHVKGRVEKVQSKISGNAVYMPSVDFYS